MPQPKSFEKKLDILDIIKKSYVLYKSNFSLLFIISLLAHSISLLEQLFHASNISIGWFGFVTFVGGLIISFWGHIALLFAASERYSQRDVAVKEAFVKTKSKIWRFICVSTFCAFLSLGGFLLCVVPGVYWWTVLGLAGMLVVLEDRAFFESLKRSRNLIRGYFWPVFLLGCLIGLIFSPINAVHFLDVPINIKIFCLFLFSILSGPFGIAVTINLYNRLKQLKEDEELVQAEVTKKGGGCLGCLAGFGLFILIIVLSSFWIGNLIGFVKTDRGIKYYEWMAKQVSPEITFPGGISMARPENYLVMKADYKLLQYTFYGARKDKFFIFKAFSIPLTDLGIRDKTSIRFGEGDVWGRYWEHLTTQSRFTEKAFAGMEQEPIELLTINNRKWAELTLREKEKEYSNSHRRVWMYVYTLTDSDVIFFVYAYDEREEARFDRGSEIGKILETLNFPKE